MGYGEGAGKAGTVGDLRILGGFALERPVIHGRGEASGLEATELELGKNADEAGAAITGFVCYAPEGICSLGGKGGSDCSNTCHYLPDVTIVVD
jgi:hypothetical protein